jgi:hypothetical protein
MLVKKAKRLLLAAIVAAGCIVTFSAAHADSTHIRRTNVCLGEYLHGFKPEPGKSYNVVTNCPADVAAARRSAKIQEQEEAYANKHRVNVCLGDLGHVRLERGQPYNILTNCPKDIAAARRAARIEAQEQAYADKHRINVCLEDLGKSVRLERGKFYNILTTCHAR